MAELWTDVIKPADATGFSREIVERDEAAPGALGDVFPSIQVNDVTYEWELNHKHQDIAAFRSFNAESKIIGGGQFETRTAKLIPMSVKQPFKEYDRIRRMGQNSPETVQAAFDRLNREVTESMVRRTILARGEALSTGKLSIREEGLIQNVDYERREDFTKTLATGWDGDGADPIRDLESLREEYVNENGGVWSQAITSSKVISTLLRATGLRDYLGTNAPSLLTRDAVTQILQSYGFPAFTIVDDFVTFADPITGQRTRKRVLPEDSVIFAAPNAGATVWGITAEAGEPEYGLAGDLPGMVSGAYKTNDPLTYWVHANATVLPVLINANATMKVKVLSGN